MAPPLGDGVWGRAAPRMTAPLSPWVLSLADVDPDADAARVGGKAAQLARLRRAGLQVPGGFVITTDAYADFRNNRYDPQTPLVPVAGPHAASHRGGRGLRPLAAAAMAGVADVAGARRSGGRNRSPGTL